MSRVVQAAMGRKRRLLGLAPLLSLLGVGACASVLGIEDIHEGPAPGDAGETGSGASSSTGGKANNGGKSGGGDAPMGGEDTGVGGLPGPVTGGVGNEAGEGNVGGSPPIDDPTVRGKVIDFWGQTVPNIPVQIGETLVSTDAQGRFEFADVPAEYEVSLAIELDPITSHGWVYQGLTRRDPTLQVYSGLPDRSGNFEMQPLDVTIGTNQKVMVSIGAPGGAEEYSGYENGLSTSHYWRGGATTQATAHALFWQYNAATDFPTSYLGFDSTLVALSEAQSTNIAFSLAGDPLDSGNLQGTVTGATNVDRENYIYLRFPTGDRIVLVEDYPNAPDSFTYVVPDTPMGSVTAAAVEGYAVAGDFAVAHQSGLAAGSTATLTIPLPGSLVAPVDGRDNVDLTTQFSYLAGAGSAGTHLVAIRSTFDSCCYDAIYIATTKTQFTIPEVVGGNFLKGGEGYYWRVETHGKLATVDAMTGPTGFMDAFSADEESPQGPRSENGQYSVTSRRIFTAAP